MAKPALTEADLRQAHAWLRLTTPFESLTALQRALVSTLAGARVKRRCGRPAPRGVDFKRRAAGDFGD